MSSLPTRLRAALALAVLAAMTLSATLGWADSAPAPAHDHYLVDDQGRPMRVVFPLHDRVVFDAYATRQAEMARGLGLAIHHSFEVAYPDEEIWWRFRHRWLAARATRSGDEFQLGITLLSATYMRHATSSYIVIPSADHARLPTPFDLAFEYDLFDLNLDPETRQISSARIAEFAFLLDFLRDSSYRHRLAIGPLMAYEIDEIEGLEGSDQEEIRRAHTFIPASGGRLIYRWENLPGRMALDGRFQCAAAATLIDREINWHRLCSAEIKAERTFLAIADRPLNLFIEAALRESPDQPELGPPLQWSATVGLRLSLPAARMASK